MPYSGPHPERIQAQRETLFQQGSYTATWRHWVSATSGNPQIGLDGQDFYRETTISALFGRVDPKERQTPAGMIAAAQISATTKERLERQDQLVWRGITYSIDSDAMPARFIEGWITVLNREDA